MEWFWKLSGLGVLIICLSISECIDRQHTEIPKTEDRLQVACPNPEVHD